MERALLGLKTHILRKHAQIQNHFASRSAEPLAKLRATESDDFAGDPALAKNKSCRNVLEMGLSRGNLLSPNKRATEETTPPSCRLLRLRS
jgi:hypothetical protein